MYFKYKYYYDKKFISKFIIYIFHKMLLKEAMKYLEKHLIGKVAKQKN